MFDNTNISRRNVLTRVGASTAAIGGLAGLTTADDGGDLTQQLPTLSTDVLTASQTRQHLRKATADGPGEKLVEFAERNGHEIDDGSLTGRRIRSNAFPEHVVIDADLRDETTDQVGHVQLRAYDERVTPDGVGGTVTAEATIDGTAYRSTPLTAGDAGGAGSIRPAGSVDTVATGVVESLEWQRSCTAGVTTADWPWNCMVSGTYAAGGPACMVLGGLTTIAGAVLMLIPEPGSTAVGTVAVGTALSGSCGLAEGLEQMLNTDCEINSIGLCVTYPGLFSPPDIYVFPAGDCYAY